MKLSTIAVFSFLLLFLQCSQIEANQAYLLIQGGEGDMVTGDLKSNYSHQKTGGFASRIALGYLFNLTSKLQIGPELGYIHYRKSHYTQNDKHGNILATYNYTGHTRDLLINLRYAITPQLYGIGKAGVAYVQKKSTLTTSFLSPTIATKTKALPEVTIGLGFNFNRYIGITGTINNTIGGKHAIEGTTIKESQSVANISSIMLGLRLSFP